MGKQGTLITDPFEDDAVSILEWAYGPAARTSFEQFRINSVQRVGQAFMNTLYKFDPDEYNRLSGSIYDPFYIDTKIRVAIDKLTSK